jgi:CheY-like chemotaxis protein
MMPGTDGGELAAQFRVHPRLKNIPVVFLTAAVKKEEVQSCSGLIGGFPYLAKPVDLKELVARIEKSLNETDHTEGDLDPHRAHRPCTPVLE